MPRPTGQRYMTEAAVGIRAVQALLYGWVDLTVPNVVPGEPLTIRWRLDPGFVKHPDIHTLSLRVSIDGRLVHERNGIPFKEAVRASNPQTETIVIKAPGVAQAVYALGTKQVTAELRSEDRAHTWAGGVRVRVIREPVDASWWEWRGPLFESIPWKRGYALDGSFVNHSRFASMAVVHAELSEVRSEENPQIDPCDYGPAVPRQARTGVGPGKSAEFRFALKHAWRWLTNLLVGYVVTGPINKTFAYAVYFQVTDQFGNAYPWRCSPRRHRHVGVPKHKRLAGVAAQTASLAGWTSGPVLKIAFKALAMYYAAIAKDPPAPDERYAAYVEVVPLPVPRLEDDEAASSHPALVSLLGKAAHLASLENARTVCRARLIGARLAGDESAIQLQQGRYLEIEEEMGEAAREIGEILPAAQREMEEEGPVSEVALPEMLLLEVEDLAGSDGDTADFLAFAGDRDLAQLVLGDVPLSVAFGAALQGFVEEVRQERDTVMEGEEYIHVAEGAVMDRENLELEATLRSRLPVE